MKQWLILAVAGIVLLLGLLHPGGRWGLEDDAAAALGVLVCTIILWISRVLPLSVTSLLAVGLLIITGVSETFSTAAQGYATNTVFFLLAATIMAQGIENAGLIERIARLAGRKSGASPRRAFWLIAGLTGATALVMPSALVRAKAFLPLITRMDDLLTDKDEKHSQFLTASGLALGVLGPIGSISFLTGGGVSIVAAGTIAEFYQPISWLQWFLMMAPAGALLIGLLSWFILRRFPPEESVAAAAELEPSAKSAPFRGREIFATVVLVVTLALWLFSNLLDLPLAIPAIIAAVVLALPPTRLITFDSIQKQRWDPILVVGSGLSLSAALSQTGAINWMAEGIFAYFPGDATPLLTYGLIILFTMVIRQFFLLPSPCLVIALPIVIELARVTGVDPLFLAMLASSVIAAVHIVPVQSPPSLLFFSHGIFTLKDQLKVVPGLILVTTLVMLAVAMLYWPLLRALGWI